MVVAAFEKRKLATKKAAEQTNLPRVLTCRKRRVVRRRTPKGIDGPRCGVFTQEKTFFQVLSFHNLCEHGSPRQSLSWA